jgi:hypothetical protein
VVLESIFEALETIFEVGFEFLDVFQLGLARNEESCRKWWVMAGSVDAGECRRWRGEGELEKKKKKKKKTRCVREVREKEVKKKKNRMFCSHFIFLEIVRCKHVNGGQKTPPFCPIRIATALNNLSFSISMWLCTYILFLSFSTSLWKKNTDFV